MGNKVIAVVGGGASGALAVAHLLRWDIRQRVVVIDPGDAIGRGVAYSTTDPLHLLNVRTGDMSAFADDPDHFAAWAGGREPTAPHSFLPRMRYGDYLSRLSSGVEHVPLAATDVIPTGRGAQVVLDGGARLQVDQVVLALGWAPPRWPAGLGWCDPRCVTDPWRDDPLGRVDPDRPVLLLGTGLTATDMMLSLHAAGHRQIVAASRHGLLPMVHPERPEPADSLDLPDRLTARGLLASARTAATRDGGWDAFANSVRPRIDLLWSSLSTDEQSRLLRHLHRRWDVLRHRMAPASGSQIEAMRRSGDVVVVKGGVLKLRPSPDGIDVWFADRRIRVGTVINCSGPTQDIGRTSDRLLSQLLRRRVVRPGPHAIGLETDTEGLVPETAGAIWVIGPLRRGHTWETTAIPDIRVQAADLARAIATEAQAVGA